MSHTSKIPPAKYATSDLPTDVAVGTIVFDETTSEHKSFNGSSWEAIEGGGIGTQTIVFDSTGPSYDQIQGDIPASWKQNDSSLRGLVIGTSCTSIGSNAFYYCGGLTGDLVIPDSVTSIGNSAFYLCSGLTGDLVIPNSVTSIGSSAFDSCLSLIGNLVIPDSVTSIGVAAFFTCGFTGSLTIPDSVTTIGSYAFRSCTGLTALYTNTPAASWVGTDALDNTTALVNIYEGPDVTGQYSATFQGGSGMTVSAWTNYPNIP